MGKLLVMPLTSAAARTSEVRISVAHEGCESLPQGRGEGSSFAAWLDAPRERMPEYFAVYTSVSHAIQAALRGWVRQWLHSQPGVMQYKAVAYPLVTFSCTRPFRGRSTGMFTYDVQQSTALDRALFTASRILARELEAINNAHRGTREFRPMTLIPGNIAVYIRQNRRDIYRMFHVETCLMDEILRFSQHNIDQMGLEKAVAVLRKEVAKHLHRFTSHFDMAEHTDELLKIATDALRDRITDDEEMPVAA
jgi:hypothetical protein